MITIVLPAEVQADLDYAAAQAGRPAADLCAQFVAQAVDRYREPRLRVAAQDALAFKKHFDAAKPTDTKAAIEAIAAKAVSAAPAVEAVKE